MHLKYLLNIFFQVMILFAIYLLASAGHIQEVRLATKCGRFLFFLVQRKKESNSHSSSDMEKNIHIPKKLIPYSCLFVDLWNGR